MTTESVRDYALALGFDSAGVCSASVPTHSDVFRLWLERGHHASMDYLARSVGLRRDPSSILPGVRSIVAVTLNYHQPNPHQPGRPRIAEYALGRDYHRVLRSKLRRLASFIGGACRVCVDSAPAFEREYAHLAGLGWFGKNTMLIDSRRGSRFFIGLVLTTAELEPDSPSDGGCGTCRLCIDACPTGAIVHRDGRWQLDSRRCISYLTIEHRGTIPAGLTPKIGDWTFGCDVCQDVCPFNQERPTQPMRARLTSVDDFKRRPLPDLSALKEMDEAAWDSITAGSPLRRCGYAGLRRNAAINLENAASS